MGYDDGWDDRWEEGGVGHLVLSVLRPPIAEAEFLVELLDRGEWNPALGEALPRALAAVQEGDGRADALELVAMIVAVAGGRSEVRAEVVPVLLDLLTDRSRSVRQGVVAVLAEFPDVEVMSALQARWDDEPTQHVRLDLERAIERAGGTVAITDQTSTST